MKKNYLLLLFLSVWTFACQNATLSIQLQKDIKTIQQHTILGLNRIDYFNYNLDYESYDRPILKPFCVAMNRIEEALMEYYINSNRIIQELQTSKEIDLPIFLSKKETVFNSSKQQFQLVITTALDTLKQDTILKSIVIGTKLDSLFEPLQHSFKIENPILVDYKKQTSQEIVLGLCIEQNQVINAVLESSIQLQQLLMRIDTVLYEFDIEAISLNPKARINKPFEVYIKPIYYSINSTFKVIANNETIPLPMVNNKAKYRAAANKIGENVLKAKFLIQNSLTGEITTIRRDFWYEVIP